MAQTFDAVAQRPGGASFIDDRLAVSRATLLMLRRGDSYPWVRSHSAAVLGPMATET